VNVGGSTRLAAIIGDPVRHSLSPAMHNAAFAATGLDWVFVALPVERGAGARALDAIRVLGIEGLSVTMPHKADAAAAVDEVRGDAQRLRSVNCVSRGAGGTLVGESTDGEGFLRSLREEGHDPAGLDALVLGAGGAARSVLLALAQAGARVRVAARRPEAAADAAALDASISTVAWDSVGSVARACGLVVNATPIGMGARDRAEPGGVLAALPIGPDDLGPGQVVADLVYQPRRTAFLELAASRGAATVDGVGMLVHQGAIAFERWTGTAAPVAVMRTAVLSGLG
jgi:shikimate dehydrogenase